MSTGTETGIIASVILAVGALFGAVSKHVYVSKKDCKEKRTECQAGVSDKIDTLSDDFKEFKITHDDYMKEIAEHMGAVKQYMKGH